MTYKKRIKIAVLFSLLLHIVFFIVWALLHLGESFGPSKHEPVVVAFQLAPRTPRTLITPTSPSEEKPERSDQIAETNARAADSELRAGDRVGPIFEQEAQVETLATSPVPAPNPVEQPKESTSESSAQTESSELSKPAEPAKPEEPPKPDKRELPAKPKTKAMKVATNAPAKPEKKADNPGVTTSSQPPMKDSKAASASTLPGSFEQNKGNTNNAVKASGSTNFDAIRDEIAPYLRQVRRKVELRWNQALLLNYKGTSPTEATVDCAIAPDGKLVSVELVGDTEDRIYAALCRDAIQRAAPFGAFPFDIPEIYRGQNLEIRWTFSFL